MFFDPRHVFLIYVPVIFALNRNVGKKLILSLTIAEWSNQILKWFLAGERPYWYVHERLHMMQSKSSILYQYMPTSTAGNSTDGDLNDHYHEIQQFPVTCELGAGSPSGHAMVTASVWYILIESLLSGELFQTTASQQGPNQQASPTNNKGSNLISKLGWTTYSIILGLVSLSRVFLACHFPHQCICGALMGMAIAKFITESDLSFLRVKHFPLGTIAMLTTAMSTYGFLLWMGFNPLWSVDKAIRWCVKQEYIHMDTTPFFSMMRYTGFYLGAGLGLFSLFVAKQQQSSQSISLISKVLASCLSILFGRLLMAIPVSKESMGSFYVISFITYVTFSYAFVGPIPYYADTLVSKVLGKSRSQQKINVH